MGKEIILLIFCILIFLTSCTTPKATNPQDKNQSILGEITKLNNLNSIGRLYPANFSNLESMLSNNDYAMDEIKEIKTMSKYKEYEHVFHGFEFLSDYITTGKPTICPGHSLAHYYIFMKHNETELAKNNLDEAKNVFTRWIPLAKAYNEQYNLTTDFNGTVERLQSDIVSIENGNITGSGSETDWLAADGSICVEDTSN